MQRKCFFGVEKKGEMNKLIIGRRNALGSISKKRTNDFKETGNSICDGIRSYRICFRRYS